MQNNLSADMYSTARRTSGKQVGGLQLLVADAPTSGTVGGIDRATYTFWRNQVFSGLTNGGGAVSATNIQSYMNQLWLATKRQSDGRPDHRRQQLLHFYWQSLQAIQRITTATWARRASVAEVHGRRRGGGRRHRRRPARPTTCTS
jgi:hypothetical protein